MRQHAGVSGERGIVEVVARRRRGEAVDDELVRSVLRREMELAPTPTLDDATWWNARSPPHCKAS